jgi:CHAT domain-containing protein
MLACGRDSAPPRAVLGGPADSLALDLANSQYQRGEYDSARTTLNDELARAGRSGDSANVARAWTTVSIIARTQGRYAEAESLGERALSLKRRLGLKAELPRSLNALGLLAHNRGQYDKAILLYQEAREVAEAGGDSTYVARVRGNLGLTYANVGDLDAARRELLLFRGFSAAHKNTRDELNARNNLGMVETRAGDPVAALAWLPDARVGYAKIGYAVGEENALGQLGVAYQELGETSRALAYLDSARSVAAKSGLLEQETDDLELTAELYQEAGDPKRALDVLARARMLADSLKMQAKLGHIRLTEAEAYSSLGMTRVALARATEAAQVEQTADSPIDELAARLEMASVAQHLGDSKNAIAALSRAQTLADKLGSGVARIQFALGAARVADLAHLDDQVLASLDRDKSDTTLLTAGERSEVEALRARALFRKKDYASAAIAGRRAVDAVERLSSLVVSPALRTSYTAGRSGTYADLVVTLLALNRIDDAFKVADAARGRALIDRLSTARRDLPRIGAAGDLGAADSLIRRINALVERLRIADTTHPARPDRGASSTFGESTRAIAAARAAYDSLVDRMARANSSGAIIGAGSVDVSSVKRSLGADERLLEYFVTPDSLLIFVVSLRSIDFVAVPVSGATLAEQTRLARELIAERTDASAPLAALFAQLIRPLEKRNLLAGARSLIVVPHGVLNYLPFAALAESPEAPYLAERFSLVMLTSAAALVPLRTRHASASATPAMVFAPLTRALPGTRGEAAAVARALSVREILDSGASERALRNALQSAAIVHVASHALLDASRPMFSAIELAPARGSSESDDDGQLETHEVLGLQVNSRLVFLSGCETALGSFAPTSLYTGEDYATLAQAFLFAGARNVVATLWRIDDQGAAVFAGQFYQRLSGSSPADALASAQRALIHDRRFAAPYYWAAYTLSGAATLQ